MINLTRGLSILLIFKKKKTLQLFNFTDFSPCSSTFYFIDLCPAVYYFLSPADSGCNLLFFFYFFKMEADKHRFEVLLAFKQVSAVTFPPSVAWSPSHPFWCAVFWRSIHCLSLPLCGFFSLLLCMCGHFLSIAGHCYFVSLCFGYFRFPACFSELCPGV